MASSIRPPWRSWQNIALHLSKVSEDQLSEPLRSANGAVSLCCLAGFLLIGLIAGIMRGGVCQLCASYRSLKADIRMSNLCLSR